MEQIIKILVYIHAFFGGIGLITGTVSIYIEKGNSIHKKSGKIFSISMCISSLLALIISRLPEHKNLFLFLIGIFTIYMVLAGNRALTFKNSQKLNADWIDKLISGTMFLTAIIMLAIGLLGAIEKNVNSTLYIFFGMFGAFMSLKDFKTFKTFKENKKAWLISHLGRMTGALIASFTAFIVAGLNIGTVFIWMLPTIIGTVYIINWNRKLKSKQ